MIRFQLITTLLLLLSLTVSGQSSNDANTQESRGERSINIKGDTRQTLLNDQSVAIFGIRLGIALNDKIEVGTGIYSSNLFGLLGASANKNYEDKSVDPARLLNSEIGFHYFSLFGEYTLLRSDRLILTTNHQLGLGWVDIDFIEPNEEVESIIEGKSLIEHSITADVKTTDWLRLSGGIGYRYLIRGETQIKETFNAPIFIVGFSINYGKLFGRS